MTSRIWAVSHGRSPSHSCWDFMPGPLTPRSPWMAVKLPRPPGSPASNCTRHALMEVFACLRRFPSPGS